MFKDFIGWSLESIGKATVETKYTVEYITDGKIADSLKSSFDVFEEVTSEKYVDEKIEKYLAQLSILQRKIVDLLSAGYKKSEIIIRLHITEKEYINNLGVIQDYRNIKFLI